jgi:hypothetical protein
MRYRTDAYFPSAFNYLAAIFGFIGFYLLFTEIYLAIFLILISLFIFNAHTVVEIDPKKRFIRPFTSFLGLKFGKKEMLEEVAFIYINAIRITQSYYSISNRQHTQDNVKFFAFIKYNGDQKEKLFGYKNKGRTMAKAIKLATALQVEIKDNTAN